MAAVPDTQVPPEQQPPLHASLALQAVEQRCVTGLHAEPCGQSAGALQPQCEPVIAPLPGMHAEPRGLAVQSRHVPPDPHEPAVLPGSHVPPAPQQLPAQAFPSPQLTVQMPLGPQVLPNGQSSPRFEQPH